MVDSLEPRSLFKLWHSRATLMNDAETENLRWDAANAASALITRSSALDHVSLTFAPESAEPGLLSAAEDIIREVDSTISAVESPTEFGIILAAGCALILSGPPSDIADQVALAIVARTMNGKYRHQHAYELNQLVDRYLIDRSHSRSQIRPRDLSELSAYKKGLITRRLNEMDHTWELEDGSNAEAIRVAFDQIVDAYGDSIESLEASSSNLSERIRNVEDESNILWWVFNEYCYELAAPIGDLERDRALLPLTFELASLVRSSIPPPRYGELLKRALSRSKGKQEANLTVKTAIDATPQKWRVKIAERTRTLRHVQMFPIFAAIRESSNSGKGRNWSEKFYSIIRGNISSTGMIDLEESMPVEEITSQFFIESVLALKQDGV